MLRVFIIFIALLLNSCYIFHPLYEEQKEDVDKYRMIEVGGVKQAIMIRGYSPGKPVMLYLHGGPGFPLFPYLQQNDAKMQMEEHYTMVYWEQRGTGKSFNYNIPGKSMRIEQFVDDTKQVIEYVLSVTGRERVFLWAHSWGTNFGALFASRYPELVHAYISTGQSVIPLKNEHLAFTYVYQKAKQENNKKALRELQTISQDEGKYTLDDALTVRKWVYRYGGIVKQMDEVRSYVDIDDAITILSSPEYNFVDKLKLLINPYYSINELWDDLMELDLMKEAPVIEVPVYFLLGRYDIIVSSLLAENYFNVLKAPNGKNLVWFENSAHRPFNEETSKFLEVMEEISLDVNTYREKN